MSKSEEESEVRLLWSMLSWSSSVLEETVYETVVFETGCQEFAAKNSQMDELSVVNLLPLSESDSSAVLLGET